MRTHPKPGRSSPFRSPSAWIPVLMSGAATALVVGYLATGPHPPTMILDNGVMRQDESPAARLWQLLIALQLPAVLIFAGTWFARDPKRTAGMLTLQALAVVMAVMTVVLIET